MDEDEDIDIDIESSDEGATARLKSLARTLPPFVQKSKSRSLSPFSNASSRSRLSSDFDTDSDRDLDDLDDDDDEETLESGSVRKLSTASSPALSDIHGSASDPYTNTNFNTSSSSINSTGTTGSSFKPSLKDVQYDQQSQSQKPQHFSQIYDKISHLPKERRTVSFGAVHVAELQPDITSYDEEGGSSEDGSSDRPESDDGEEEEGSLGTGQRKSAAMAGVSPFRKARLSVSGPQTVRRILDKDVITDEEKRVHYEFFCNKASKTPERYQRIRNTILQAWEKSPSTYLTKTSVRSGLKDCGDVNAIGRVHSWLESIGAINVGMTASSPGASLARPRNGGNNSSKRRVHSEERGWSSSSSSSAPAVSRRARTAYTEVDDLDSVWVTPPLRRRRVRNEKGEWVDERELEGHVIEHNVHKDVLEGRRPSEEDDSLLNDAEFFERHGMTRDEMEEEYEQERLAAQNAKYFAATEVLPVNTRVPKNKRAQHLLRQSRGHRHDYDDGEMEGVAEGYDPFRLIPLRKYNQQNLAPFRVKVSSDAMLIMDFHSHLAETEIIGLLGGLYDEDERILFILSVFPCRSLSTSLQCEIDPVSDIEARSFFSSKGFVVVGWYHSHPTFEPTPSVRDIENQTDYQTMFRRHELGVEPFVGVIVSPFDPRNLSYLSEFQFLSVSERFDENLNCRKFAI
ncbi:Myb-like, SWIRM and MPN domains 1 [Podila horticola]|nr:Myb-like, SWIRM and MPN domains 1 [Podila horticola]